MSLERCRVVLVRTQFAGNLGSTARIMRNMGMTDLRLVSPEADPADRQAKQLSTHGEEILNNARVVQDLGDALADCTLVVATSGRTGGFYRQQSVGSPREIGQAMVSHLSTGPAALVFGPEATGLTNDEITRCQRLIHIPADPGYPALNLAQAVTICLYEIRCAWLEQTTIQSTLEPPASFDHIDRMFAQLKAALEDIHFLYGPNADALMHALRQIISRAQPNATEVDILFGLARQMQWYVKNGSRK
jgi:TrmH family RNA methyltransferase